MTSVSVIVPVRNGETYLAEALQSALHQICQPLEVLVVDDGSTDASADVAAAFAGVRVLRRPPEGASAARNAGVRASQGELIAFLDADDVWPEDKLEVQLAYLRDHPEAGVVLGREAAFLSGTDQAPPWATGLATPGSVGAASPMTALLRREVWDLVGPMDPSLTHGEDTDWLMRASELDVRIAVIEHVVLRRRLHGANATYDDARMRRGMALVLKGRIDRRRSRERG